MNVYFNAEVYILCVYPSACRSTRMTQILTAQQRVGNCSQYRPVQFAFFCYNGEKPILQLVSLCYDISPIVLVNFQLNTLVDIAEN